MNSQTQNPKNPEITEELKNAIYNSWVNPPTYSIFVGEDEEIKDFYMNETDELLEYIKNMDLNEYINEEGKREKIELIYNNDSGCGGKVVYVIQEWEDDEAVPVWRRRQD